VRKLINRSPPALSGGAAVADAAAAAQSEERIRDLENEISDLRNSISAMAAGQNETNQLILTLFRSQRSQNPSQCNTILLHPIPSHPPMNLTKRTQINSIQFLHLQ